MTRDDGVCTQVDRRDELPLHSKDEDEDAALGRRNTYWYVWFPGSNLGLSVQSKNSGEIHGYMRLSSAMTLCVLMARPS